MATKKTPQPSQSQYPTEGFASVKKASQFLDCSLDTVYRMAADGQIESVRIRELVRIPWAALHRLLASASK